jgi:hypothetical protein
MLSIEFILVIKGMLINVLGPTPIIARVSPRYRYGS